MQLINWLGHECVKYLEASRGIAFYRQGQVEWQLTAEAFGAKRPDLNGIKDP